MQTLLDGYRRFRDGAWPDRRAVFERLAAQGQRPRTMVIACSDSRVDPGMIFDAGPGELFVVRNVANLVPPYQPDGQYHGTSAALEFGICSLGIGELIVMGHALCGGVHALLADGEPPGDFVGPWIRLADRARTRVLACDTPDRQLAGEHEVVRVSIENLATFPWIADRVADGRLRLHGMHFDVRSGVLARLGPDDTFQAA
ncbi:MAG: carbonic anhydrase [Gemmatimonadaceae bacterium]|nr:carbonic anhydrase [Acetobacteraceae bacterium]